MQHLILASVMALIFASVISPLIAQQADPAQPPKPATIEGRAVNAKTGEALRRVYITLRPMGGRGTISAEAPYAATTDAEGKYRIEKVDPGQYRMAAERQGFVRSEYGARQNNSMMGTTIQVSAGQELKEINLSLIPQAVIMGRVFDEEGEPLAHVQLQVLRRRFFRGKQQLAPWGGTQTIDTGEFRVANLPPGRYWISATSQGRMMMLGEAPARNTGDKPEEAYVTTYYPGTTDQSSARPIDLVAGQEVPGSDIRMQKARVFRVRGKVSGAMPSQRNMRVMLAQREWPTLFMGPNSGGMVKEDGSFEIANVQAGSYYVIAMANQGMPRTAGKTAVDVTRDNVENVSVVLSPGVSLNGNIRIDGDVEAFERAQGKKVNFASVRIQLTPVEGMPFNVPGVQAKDDGSFVLENAVPEKYRIVVLNPPQGTWLKSIRAGDQEALDKGVDASAGAPGPLQVTLGLGPGTVSGTVQDAKQKPAAGSMVTLLPDPIKEERMDLYRMTTADQNGQFSMPSVPPGDYKVYAWNDIDPGSYMDPELLKKHESQSKKLTVKENSQQSVSLTQIEAEAQ